MDNLTGGFILNLTDIFSHNFEDFPQKFSGEFIPEIWENVCRRLLRIRTTTLENFSQNFLYNYFRKFWKIHINNEEFFKEILGNFFWNFQSVLTEDARYTDFSHRNSWEFLLQSLDNIFKKFWIICPENFEGFFQKILEIFFPGILNNFF